MKKWTICLLWGILFVAYTAKADITVSDEDELRDLATAVNDGNGYAGEIVYLANDINLKEGDWTPIGTSGHPFKGRFEGWGHKISGLTINNSNSDYQGLFGCIDGGSVRDVAVVANSSIVGGQYVGAICGCLKGNGVISSCYSEASITGTNYVGGICGSSEGIVRDCYVTGDLTSTSSADEVYVGGIVGYTSGALQYCYMTGRMSIAGNIAGKYKYYYGAIVGGKRAGEAGATVGYCIYNSETISQSPIFAIGGDNGNYGSATDLDDEHVTGQTTSVMKDEKFWKGTREGSGDFVLNEEETTHNNIVWKIVGGSYPQLYSFVKNEPMSFNFSPNAWQTVVPNGNYTVPSGMEAYIVSSIKTDGTVMLRRVTTLNEGHGALLYCSCVATISVSSTTGTLDDYTCDRWLKGSHVSPVTIGGSGTRDYTLAKNSKDEYYFKRAQSGQLARGKAYLHLESENISVESRTSLLIRFEDSPTVVHEVTIGDSDETVYDLRGRKCSGAQRQSLMIINGKKMLKR